MTDNRFELSRRKILAGAGTIGVAGAGLGLGTSALYSDQEGFANNEITAGTLDMVVDWEEHYSFPQLFGLGDPASNLTVTRDQPQNPGDFTAFPPGVEASDDDPILWVANEDVAAYMDNTAIDAFPDAGNDGAQDEFDDANACSELVNVGEGAGGLSNTARTQNEATSLGDPLIQLGDVKPGDFGEVTLSFHLCNNPGYVWINADNVSAAENGVTEPEGDSPAEGGPENSTDPADVELLDTIQTALWYDDNCDNLTQPGEGDTGGSNKADICFVIDASGSMSDDRSDLENGISNAASQLASQGLDVTFSVVDYLQGAGVGLQPTPSVTDLENDLNDGSDGTSGSPSGSFGESLSNAILFASQNVNFRPDAKRIYVGFTDEPDQSTTQEKNDAISEINSTNSAFLGISTQQSQVSELLNGANQSQWVDLDSPQFATVLEQLVGFVGGVTGGEEIFFQGTLREALTALTDGGGIPLDGDGGNDFNELTDPEDAESRGCYAESPATHCIGFSWWVPVDTGNQIQSDSVGFDLGFYTEQCRNNSGTFGNA